MGPQVAKVLIYGILGLQLESPETKWHLGVGLVVKHIEYYKREGDSFPQVHVVVNLMSQCLLVANLCIKSAPTTH